MRLHMILKSVETQVTQVPSACRWCGSQHVDRWEQVVKRLRDTRVEQVQAERWFCRTCRRTWRVYPLGVTHAQRSQRLAGTAVMLYLLGLSYGAVALALGAMGHPSPRAASLMRSRRRRRGCRACGAGRSWGACAPRRWRAIS